MIGHQLHLNDESLKTSINGRAQENRVFQVIFRFISKLRCSYKLYHCWLVPFFKQLSIFGIFKICCPCYDQLHGGALCTWQHPIHNASSQYPAQHLPISSAYQHHLHSVVTKASQDEKWSIGHRWHFEDESGDCLIERVCYITSGWLAQ